jgi:hypothetical protein
MMNLPNPPERYDPAVERARNDVLEHADHDNLKSGRDITIHPPSNERLILYSPGGTAWEVLVDDAGVISASALP